MAVTNYPNISGVGADPIQGTNITNFPDVSGVPDPEEEE